MAFIFQMENLPEVSLEVERATISLFRPALTAQQVFGLFVQVVTREKEVETPDGESYPLAPCYYTEWLDVHSGRLASRDLSCLDGYEMLYDQERADELGFEQFPAAVQQDSHAPLTRGTMALWHQDAATYELTGEGQTEFGWTYRFQTSAVFKEIRFRDDNIASERTPDPMIEAEFAQFFDATAFEANWRKQGPAGREWHDFVATPKGLET